MIVVCLHKSGEFCVVESLALASSAKVSRCLVGRGRSQAWPAVLTPEWISFPD